MNDHIKVRYLRRDGSGEGTAYVSESTLKGTDKNTDMEVWLDWSPVLDSYFQVDDFEWDFDWEGIPIKRLPK